MSKPFTRSYIELRWLSLNADQLILGAYLSDFKNIMGEVLLLSVRLQITQLWLWSPPSFWGRAGANPAFFCTSTTNWTPDCSSPLQSCSILKFHPHVSCFAFFGSSFSPALSVLTPPVLRSWSRGTRDMTQCASPHSSHPQEGQCNQEVRFRVAFSLASEGEKAQTTNKRINLSTFPMQIKH